MGADVKLLFGASKGSLGQIRSDLNAMLAKLDSRPIRVKVGLDINKASIDSFRTQIAEITKSLGGAAVLTTSSIGGVPKGFASDMTNIATQASKASNAIYSMSAALSSANADKVSKALSGIGGVSPQGVEAITSSLQEANVIIDKVRANWSQVAGKEQEVVALTVNGTNTLGQSVSYLIKYNQITGEISRVSGAITTEFKRANTEAVKTTNAIGNIGSIIKEISATNATITSSYKSVSGKLASGNQDGNNAEALTLLKQKYIELTSAVDTLQQKRDTATQTEINNIYRLQAEMQGLLSSYSASLNTSSNGVMSEKERMDALTAVDNLLKQVTISQEKWTAAANGKSSGDYANLKTYGDMLRSLKQRLTDASISSREYKTVMSELRNGVTISSNAIRTAGEATQSFSDRLKALSAKFSTWFGITRIVMAAVRTVKKMVTNVIELDTAMTELKKVTNETDETYEKFLVNAASRSKALGASLKDTVSATADFARLGFNIEEASKLADAAIVYKNVGDGIDDIGAASESIIATMQAFGVNAEDVMLIVDKFNEVGNNFAISSKGVGDALLRSAAALQSANNTLDQSIALATAANTIVQDPEKVGTTLKTVSMFLRAAKTEAEEAGESTEGMANSVSELRDTILSLTGGQVDIQIDEDTFKSTYDILRELSLVWDDLTDVSQANILEMVGGKRNSNVVAAILENFDIAEKALKTSAGSAGSALSENEKVLDSLQGKLNVLTATFEDLSRILIDSGFLGGAIDLLTKFLETLTILADTIGPLPTIIGAVTVALSAFGKSAGVFSASGKQIQLFGKSFSNIASDFNTLKAVSAGVGIKSIFSSQGANESIIALKNFSDAIDGGTPKVQAYKQYISGMDEATRKAAVQIAGGSATVKTFSKNTDALGIKAKAAAVGVGILNTAMNMLLSFAISSLISGIIKGLDYLINYADKKAEEARDKADESRDAADKQNEKLESLDGLIERYNKLAESGIRDAESRKEALEIQNDIIDLVGEQAAGLDLVNGKLDEEIRKLLKIKDIESGNTVSDYRKSYYDSSESAEATVYHKGNWVDNVGLNAGGKGNDVITFDFWGETEERDAGLKLINDLWMEKGYGSAGTVVQDFGVFFDSFGELTFAEGMTLEQKKQAVDDAIKLLESEGYEGTKLWNELVNVRSELFGADSEYLKQTQEANNLLDALTRDKIGEGENVTTYEQYVNYRQKLIDEIMSDQAIKDAIQAGVLSEDQVETMVDGYLGTMSKYSSYYTEWMSNLNQTTKEGASENEKYIDSMSNAFGKLEKGLSSLGKIQEDISNGGDFDYSSVLNNADFEKTFGGLEEYDEFVTTVLNNPDDINACKDAFNNLTTAYILNSGALSGVTEESRDATIAMLKQMGIANAASIVDRQLAYNKEYLKYTTGSYADMTYEEIVALYAECEAGSLTSQVLARLMLEKLRANQVSIRTSGDIDNLIGLARAANATTESINTLVEAKLAWDAAQHYQEIADNSGDEETKTYYQNLANKSLQEYNSKINKQIVYDTWNSEDLPAQFLGNGNNGNSGTEQDNWFESQYKEHEHWLAMGQESEQEYLNWLSWAYKEAYSQNLITLDDFYKYEEEVFEKSQELFDDHIRDMEHEIEMLGRKGDNSDQVISKYRTMQQDVHTQAEYYRSLGLDENSELIQDLQKQWWDYEDSINDIQYEGTRQQIESSIDFANTKIENAVADRDYNAVSEYTSFVISGYKQMQENVHAEAEYYRSLGYSDTSEEVSSLMQLWWDYEYAMIEAVESGYDALVAAAVESIEKVEDVYNTLKSAADEYAETGNIPVDLLKSMSEIGIEYMTYLEDENGLLTINKDRIDDLVAAKTKQLAIDTALSYVEKLSIAITEGKVDEVNRLISATDSASNATWELVYANLALLDLTDEQYSQALDNINKLRSLSDSAVSSIYNDSAEERSKLLSDTEDALDTILDLTMELVEYEVNQEIEALEERVEKYQEIIDLKKEALDKTKEENDYEKEVAKKVKEIAKIQSRINELSMDDSREAQAERIKLEEEMANLQESLTDYQTDYSVDQQKEMLDEMADAYEEEKDAEIAKLEESISSTEKIYQLAIDRINNDWDGLYDDILRWNYEAGSTIESEIVGKWELASKAVKEYGGYVEAVNKITSADADENLSLGESGGYGDPEAIKNAMRSNSMKWFTASKDEQARLTAQNRDYADQLSRLYDDSVDKGDDGLWYVGDSDKPLYTLDKEEIIHKIVDKMEANSKNWKSVDDPQSQALAADNARMARYIAELSGEDVSMKEGGVWWIGNRKLYEVYHSGGVVGTPTLKQDEVMSILQNGEMVLDKQREEGLYKLVDFAQVLSDKIGSVIDVNGFYNAFSGFSLLPAAKELLSPLSSGIGSIDFSPTIEINIEHNGAMTDGDARRYGSIAAETALSELKSAFAKKGITNIGNSALK